MSYAAADELPEPRRDPTPLTASSPADLSLARIEKSIGEIERSTKRAVWIQAFGVPIVVGIVGLSTWFIQSCHSAKTNEQLERLKSSQAQTGVFYEQQLEVISESAGRLRALDNVAIAALFVKDATTRQALVDELKQWTAWISTNELFLADLSLERARDVGKLGFRIVQALEGAEASDPLIADWRQAAAEIRTALRREARHPVDQGGMP